MVPPAPDWIDGDPVDLRAWRNRQPEVLRPVLPEDVALEPAGEDEGGGILCRPTFARPGGILHFHGGGFVTGSPWTHRVVGAWIAHLSQRRVWLCPWPLAPEHLVPEQPIAAAAALTRAVERWSDDIVVSGDSAGAMMAAWAWAWAPSSTRRAVRALLTFYGAFGGMAGTGDEAEGLGPRALAAMYARLDPDGWMQRSELFRPLEPRFRVPDRTVILAAELDPLRRDSEALAAAHPVAVLLVQADAAHGFMSTPNPSLLPGSTLRRAIELACDAS